MSLRFTITNEDGVLAEYQAVTKNGSSDFTQPAGSGMRGDRSARATIVAGASAYGKLNLPVNDATPLQTDPVCIGYHFRIVEAAIWGAIDRITMVRFYNGGTEAGWLNLIRVSDTTAKLGVGIVGAMFPGEFIDTQALTVGTEYYIRLVCNWTAGTMTLYIDDSERGTATAAPPSAVKAPDRLYIGAQSTFSSPTITVDMDHLAVGDVLADVAETPFTGYRVYRGAGDIGDVDFMTEVGHTSVTAGNVTLTGLGHAAGTKYTYAVRPVLNGLETPDISCKAELVTGSDGDWVGNRPAAIPAAEGYVRSGGMIRLRWHYRKGNVAPDEFAIWCGTAGSGLGAGDPDAAETYTNDGYYEHDFTLTDGTAYYFRLAARNGAVESEPTTIGPFLADATSPPAPALVAEAPY